MRALLTATAVTAAFLTGCSSTGHPAPGVVHVVAAENVWGNIAQQIGGSHVEVTSIISDPNADPHTYETDPKDAAALSAAMFVVLNGVGYDDFAGKLLAASPSKHRTVISVAKVVGVTGNNPNPHLWYDPAYVKAAAQAIEQRFAAVEPKDSSDFRKNLQSFLASYQPYVDTLQVIKSKYAGAQIAFTERVPGYLVQTAGLTLGTPATFAQSIEDGNDPSPADTANMDDAMRHHTVRALLYNAQVTSPVTDKVKALAMAGGVPVVGVAETIPHQYQDFQSWQIGQAKAILAALGG